MDTKITVAIFVVLLLNVTLILAGFGYMQNEINQLRAEVSDLPAAPVPTEQEPTPEPESEPEPTPEEPIPEQQPVQEPIPESEPEPTETPPQTEPTPQETTEPEPTTTESPTETPQETNPPATEPQTQETIHELMAPEANLIVASWEFRRTKAGSDGGVFDATVEGFIENPNSSPLYNVEINLEFGIMQSRGALPMAVYSEDRTISIGTMAGHQSINIGSKTYGFGVIDWSSLWLNSFSYTVNWDESE
jgi:hypothetical protein